PALAAVGMAVGSGHLERRASGEALLLLFERRLDMLGLQRRRQHLEDAAFRVEVGAEERLGARRKVGVPHSAVVIQYMAERDAGNGRRDIVEQLLGAAPLVHLAR